jgi:hypothetical protein
MRAFAGRSAEAFLADLEMLVMTPAGRERTGTEFMAMFVKAGFQCLRSLPTVSPLTVFEAQPS